MSYPSSVMRQKKVNWVRGTLKPLPEKILHYAMES